MVWRYKRHYSDITLTLRKKSMNMRASGASELRHFLKFSHSKTAISFNILLILQILCLRNETFSLYHLWYDAIYKLQYTDKALTLRKCTYVRASGASELSKFSQFHILKLLFPFIYYFGTSDTLSQKHIYFQV